MLTRACEREIWRANAERGAAAQVQRPQDWLSRGLTPHLRRLHQRVAGRQSGQRLRRSRALQLHPRPRRAHTRAERCAAGGGGAGASPLNPSVFRIMTVAMFHGSLMVTLEQVQSPLTYLEQPSSTPPAPPLLIPAAAATSPTAATSFPSSALSSLSIVDEEEVATRIKTPAVLFAFERAKISALPANVLANYETEDVAYDRFSEYTAGERKAAKLEGKLEGKLEVARNLVKLGISLQQMQECTGLSSDAIESLE